ncbi:unnamed protein product, partial [Meganyctiphanes norvegica]
MTLEDLHQKFVVDEELECSYPQFTRHVPGYIIKPKPEDWGTCLCKTCLNPELKLAVIKKTLPEISIEFQDLKKEECKDAINNMYNVIKESNKTYEYLEWTQEINK